MLSPPKIRNSRIPIPVGYTAGSSTTTTSLWQVDYDGLLISEPHRRLKNGVWERGGPLYVKHRKVHHTNLPSFSFLAGGTNFHCFAAGGDVRVQNVSVPVPPSWATVRADTSSYYATGYNRARPGQPLASFGQFLIELRDLPRLPLKGFGTFGFKTISPSSVSGIGRSFFSRMIEFLRLSGDEYLNIQFGWKPFVSDLRKAYHLMKTIDKQMAQIIRDNGRNIRRRATIQDETATSQTVQESGVPWLNWVGVPPSYPISGGCNPWSRSTVTTRTKTRIWFAGSFRYYIPDTGSWQWNARARAALFGVLPTPELLWEVLPWSWLIDWFTNVGDVLANLSPNAVDNLVMNYSFIMKEVSIRTEYTNTTSYGSNTIGGKPFWDIPAFSATTSSVDEDITRTRVGGGNPFGLDVPASSLTSGQWAILAALGLSRGLVQ